MKNYKITIAYDGTRYNGWQIQKNSEMTIQGKISDVLSKMANQKIEVNGSGRTDSGVHAIGQVASFFCPDEFYSTEILSYLNQYLPDDIAVKSIEQVEPRFHARLSSTKKTYRYRIHTSNIPNVFERKYVYTYLDNALNISKMRTAAQLLCGTHDFKAFCGNPHFKKSSVRTIFSIKIEEFNSEIDIEYTGDGFLQNMVRIMTGTLIEVGIGKISPLSMPKILENQNRQLAGFTAPPQGLVLVSVDYD